MVQKLVDKYFLQRILFVWILSIVSLGSYAADRTSTGVDTVYPNNMDCTEENFVQVYLVVIDPYSTPFSIFGHACLHLRCETYDMDYVFTYENDRLGDDIGRQFRDGLRMGFLRVPTDTYLQTYATEGRGVREYELNLPITAKRELWRILDEHVVSDACLPFDYEKRGCAVTCVQWVEEALKGVPIHYAPWSDKFKGTRRELAYTAAYNTYPWDWLVATTFVGTRIDKEVALPDKLIIPADLVEVWQQATVDGRPLLSQDAQVLVPSHIHHTTPWCKPWMIGLLLLLLAMANLWWENKYIERVMLGIITAIGVVMTYIVAFSSLPCTEWNWLIIPFNPLPILLWRKWRRWLLPYWAMVVIWEIGMIASPHYLVDDSMLLLTAAWLLIGLQPYMGLLIKKQRK